MTDSTLNPNQDEDQDFNAAEGEDIAFERVLIEYANSMEDADRTSFLQQLKDDRPYYVAMVKAISEMAMLIAGSAVIDDEAEFIKLRRRILFEARSDTGETTALRLYYLNNRDAVDMDAVLDGPESHKRFDVRLTSFLEDYTQQHPA